LVAAFAQWAAGIRVDDAAAARRRERWLRQQAAEDATFAGVLVDLAERHAAVIIDVAGSRLQGRLVGVGQDFCVVADQRGAATVVRLSALSAVRAGAAAHVDPAGDRLPPLTLDFAAALAALAAERAPVRLLSRDAVVVTGTLIAAGHDVLTVGLDQPGPGPGGHPGRGVVYVPLEAVALCMPL
jgi:hypothetical protein